MQKLKHTPAFLVRLIACLALAPLAYGGSAPSWLWARSGGGATATDYCRGAACDSIGATYITGDFYGPNCLLGAELHSSVNGGADAHVIRYLPDGTAAWTRVIGGVSAESGVDIDTDSTGSAILTGTYGSSPLDCGTNAAGQPVMLYLPGGGGRGVLLVKVNALGQTEWATGFNGSGTAAGNEISTGPDNEILVTGPFAQNGSTLTLPDGSVLTKAGGDADVFVAKFSAAGVFQWGFGLNGDAHEEGRGISVDAAGNVLLCGEFDGNLTLGTNAHSSAGVSDIFVAKYDAGGGFLWSRKFGGTGADAGRGIDPAPDGGVYVSGEFTGTVTFDGFTLTAGGTTKDLFLVKLSPLGAVQWACSFGSPGNDQGCEIEADDSGNIFCAGSARTGLIFPGGVALPSAGQSDQFVAKFSPNGRLLWATNGGGPGSDSNFALGLDPQGRVSVVGFYSNTATYGTHTIPTGHGSSTDFYLARLDADTPPPAPPVANFSASITNGPAPITVTFTDQSTGIPTSWAWDFDNDGKTDSIEQNPTFPYTNAGTYSVKVTVGNAQGSDSLTLTNYITVTNPATFAAGFTASVTSGFVPLTVTFTDLSTGGPTSWEWDFQNDRTTDSTAQNPTFTFSELGTYSVKLTVRNSGEVQSLVKTLYIDVSNPDEAMLYPERTIPVGGQARSYHIHLPPTYSGDFPVPLVLDLHGSGGRGDFIAEEHGWLPLSDLHGFIVVFPNGGERFGPNGGYSWNTYWQRPQPDDVGYLAALIRHLRATYNIDSSRIYMTGHSAGAAMCNTFATFHADLLAGVAPVNGNWITTFGLPETLLAPLVPVPVWTWRGEEENQLTGLETRSVQDARQKAWWMEILEAGPAIPPVSTTDGTYNYLDEIYPSGSAEYRFTVEVGQNHPYRPQYATRIWNEFFSRLVRHPADRLPSPGLPETFALGPGQAIGNNSPLYFYGWNSAPDGSLVTTEGSPDLVSWTPFATSKVEGSHRSMFMFDHGAAVPERFFYRAQVSAAPALTPTEISVLAGSTHTFSVANGIPVNWSVIEPDGGTISPGGVFTAQGTTGTFHIRATAQSNSNLWTEATVRVVAVSPEELARYTAAADYSDSLLGDGLLVMKNGVVVFERYTGVTSSTSAHPLASGTKSFGAALFALGAADGIWTLDENVSQTITEWQGLTGKSQITIRHLITLTSGLLDSPAYNAGNVANLDTYDLAINQSSTPRMPGEACIYAPSNFQVLAAMFERKTGLDPVQYIYDRLLARLGFDPEHLALWTRDLRGKPQMAGGASFGARAWANYGRLWLQNGQWEGETVLDPQFLKLAVTYPNDAFKGYGFTWWLNVPTGDSYNPGVDDIPVDGRGDGTQIARNAPTDLFMAAGTGKQRLYVIPSEKLVVVRFGRGFGSGFSDHTLLGHILGVP